MCLHATLAVFAHAASVAPMATAPHRSVCNPPDLERLSHPKGAIVELQQQMERHPINLPFPRQRQHLTCLSALVPTSRSAPHFKQAYSAYMCGRRVTCPKDLAEAELFVVSEHEELLASRRAEPPVDGSMHARAVSVSLAIPASCTHDPRGAELVDGLAILSDGTTDDDAPITTKVRFHAYGGESIAAIQGVLARDAFCDKSINRIGVVVRWAEVVQGQTRVRAEYEECTQATRDGAGDVQAAVHRLADAHSVALPPALFKAVRCPDEAVGHYERQFANASSEFDRLVHANGEFSVTDAMAAADCSRLQIVTGVYVRVFAKALGTSGIASDDAVHAFLLCANGRADDAREYALQYREGLPPTENTAYDGLALHVAAVFIDPVMLGGMATLFAPGGKPGKPISKPHTALHKAVSTIVPFRFLMNEWRLHSCSARSLLPKVDALGAFMDTHMQRALNFFNSTFGDRVALATPSESKQKVATADLDRAAVSTEDRFYLTALGVNLTSERTCLGDAISRLMGNAPQPLIDLLVKVGTRIGLAASLNDAFARSLLSMVREEKADQAHGDEVRRLKRVADAALLMCCNKKARRASLHTSAAKLRSVVALQALRRGNKKRVAVCPADDESARSIATAIYESFAQRLLPPQPHYEEVVAVVRGHGDAIVAIAKGFAVCMISPGKAVEAFVVEYGRDLQACAVYEVQAGFPMPCGVGRLVEADAPAVILAKWCSHTSMLITSMVANPPT